MTFSGWTERPSRKTQLRTRRLLFVIGCLVIVSAGSAIAFVLEFHHPDASKPSIAYDSIVTRPRPAAVPAVAKDTAKNVVAAQPAAPHPVPPVAAQASETSSAASDLEAECRGYAIDHEWGALAQCADQLVPLAPQRAAALKTRALAEVQSAFAGFEAALRDKNLKQAKAKLDQIPTDSAQYANARRAYDSAETQAIDDLAARLAGVKDASCEGYGQLLAKERAVNPLRITAEAARRTSCVAPVKCDADVLVDRAWKQFHAAQLAASLTSYEAAYACKPDPLNLQTAFVVACSLPSAAKAKAYWKRLSLPLRAPALGTCVQHGITEAMLNAP